MRSESYGGSVVRSLVLILFLSGRLTTLTAAISFQFTEFSLEESPEQVAEKILDFSAWGTGNTYNLPNCISQVGFALNEDQWVLKFSKKKCGILDLWPEISYYHIQRVRSSALDEVSVVLRLASENEVSKTFPDESVSEQKILKSLQSEWHFKPKLSGSGTLVNYKAHAEAFSKNVGLLFIGRGFRKETEKAVKAISVALGSSS